MRETVAIETPARFATSRIETPIPLHSFGILQLYPKQMIRIRIHSKDERYIYSYHLELFSMLLFIQDRVKLTDLKKVLTFTLLG